MWIRSLPVLVMCLLMLTTCENRGVAGDESRQDDVEAARQAIDRAVTYMRDHVAVHGGYVYEVSEDFKVRYGEGEATPTEIWVQPPGTPAVGMAYLKAWRATGSQVCLDGALECARALVYGQLESGGWTDHIEFDANSRKAGRYRGERGRRSGRDVSTLDDDKSQSALRLLIETDKALNFQDAEIHEAVQFGINALLKAQFANGGFPQGWSGPVEPGPVVRASFPGYDWKTEGRFKDYWNYETLNDGLAGTVTKTLWLAFETLEDDRCKSAMMRFGDFLILAQMPEPQPAWAQQYNHQLQPIWARRFEPPAIAGRESEDAIATLLYLAEKTGERKYLEPIPAALEWIRRSRLPDGRIARFYELQTNRPLYFFRRGDEYTLTYEDDDLPTHYSFRSESQIEKLESRYQRLVSGQLPQDKVRSLKSLRKQAIEVMAHLDDQGRWVTEKKEKDGRTTRWLRSDILISRLNDLSDYVAASKQASGNEAAELKSSK